jgi:2-keto-4-pentenoate hydratase
MTIDEAYALQIESARQREARGERIAGYKVGCISGVMQRQLGLDGPVFGHVFASELHANGVTLDPGAYRGLAIEGEFAARLGPDGSIAAAFVVIELHHYTSQDRPYTAPELIRNNAIHAGVVLPEIEPVYAGEPAEITVAKNGVTLGKTALRAALAEGLEGSVRWLKSQLARFGKRLNPGDLILTGSPLPLYPAGPGDWWEASSDGMERVQARIGG